LDDHAVPCQMADGDGRALLGDEQIAAWKTDGEL
jgi:hypothetical protein